MKIQKPSVGRIVHVSHGDGVVMPAIITDVLDGGGTIRAFDFCTRIELKFEHSADGKPGTWRYPPFVKDEIEVDE